MHNRILTFAFISFAVSLLLVNFSCNTKPETITWSQHIAPIIYKNCTSCHSTGEGGGFALTTYNEVRKKAGTIAIVTQSRTMPPWPADPSYRHFADEKVLTDKEINMITSWVENGCPIGDSLNIPPVPVIRKQTSDLGKPDYSVGFPTKFLIEGNNKDVFLIMKLPFELPADTFLNTLEFISGNKTVTHHMNGNLVVFDPEKKKNVNTDNWYFKEDGLYESHNVHKHLGLLHDDGSYPLLIPSVVNYLPGVYSDRYPDGIGGWHITKKGVIYINSLHYGPSPIADSDSSWFNFFFSPTPPTRPLKEIILGTLGVAPTEPELMVPADSIKTFSAQTVINKDISITTIVPHMHLIGKNFLAYAVTPAFDTIPLIRINNWDFRWQYFYKCKTLLKIPAGSKIRAEGVYDNTAQNPNNPFYPPQPIGERNGSMRTTDEMFQLIFNYIEYKPGDENISLEIK